MIAEVTANAYAAYARLVERSKECLAFATPFAQFAIRQTRSGRRVGTRLNSRDVASPQVRAAKGIALEASTNSIKSWDNGAKSWSRTGRLGPLKRRPPGSTWPPGSSRWRAVRGKSPKC